MNMRILPVFLLVASLAFASSVWSTSALADLTGSVDSGFTAGVSDGIDVADGSLTTLFEIQWAITAINTPISGYHYQYTLTGPTGDGMGLSHFAIELPESCQTTQDCVSSVTISGADPATTQYAPNSAANGDPNYPAGASFDGIRFFGATQLTVTVSFNSTFAPVFGDFYVKLGKGDPGNGDSAWNHGSESPFNSSSNTIDYLPVPGVASDPSDPGSAAPEPASFALVGLGLVGAGLLGRRTPGRRPPSETGPRLNRE